MDEQKEIHGLSTEEAARLLAQYGENTIYHQKKLRPFVAFIKKFNSPLLIMLMGASLISFFLGQRISASIILAMIVASAVLDFINSHKSEKIAEQLIAKVSTTATVYRDGKKQEISFKLLVPGDTIELSAGDIIPADCQVLTADDLFVNQSSLTGESFPVEKHPAVKGLTENPGSGISDQSAIFMGTSIVTGYATALIMKTGANAEFGKIAEKLSTTEAETNFEKQLKTFSAFILRLTIVMVLCVFLINYIQGTKEVLDSFIFAVAIAVGLTPELLPVIMSVALSHGSMIMAKKGVIVKNLSAVQNFGGMNILCTDKTGTLTEDRITLVKCVDFAGKESDHVLLYAFLSSIFHTARKSPLDTAIQLHGSNVQMAGYKKIDEIPFDFERRRDSIVVELEGYDSRTMITKGAPENMFKATTKFLDGKEIKTITPDFALKIKKQFDTLSENGFRVLAIATKIMPEEKRSVYQKEEEMEMVFLGFAAFLDPPKKDVAHSLYALHTLNIEIKIITGDSALLTKRVCKDIGIHVKKTLTGEEIEHLSEEELIEKAPNTTIFARVSPSQKEQIVNALKKAGHVVGYMGDGINDAPVLRAADVGISVENAVDVAKETADIILMTKSLDVLKDGVIEGRKTFQNTLKYIKMGFSSNFGNMFSMMGASAFLPFLPMLPTQILFNNFLYDMSQTTIPSDNTDRESLVSPLRWNMKEFTKYIIVFGIASSIFDFLTFFTLYSVFNLQESQFQTGWFIESIATQVLIIFVIRTKRIPFFKSWPSIYVAASTVGIVALAWTIPFTPLGVLLGFTVLPIKILCTIAGIVFAYLFVGEGAKMIFYRSYPKAP
jgi:Mg2+-importing ATPase